MAAGNLLIDTSIIIDYLRKKNKRKSQFYKISATHTLFISTITLFELFAGAKNEQKMKDIDSVIEYVKMLPFTEETAKTAGEIYLALRDENKLIEAKDIFIAATALSHDLPLMTLNVKHFERIKGLEIL
jgi:predicted nucleic acid-binding protein